MKWGRGEEQADQDSGSSEETNAQTQFPSETVETTEMLSFNKQPAWLKRQNGPVYRRMLSSHSHTLGATGTAGFVEGMPAVNTAPQLSSLS